MLKMAFIKRLNYFLVYLDKEKNTKEIQYSVCKHTITYYIKHQRKDTRSMLT